MTEALLCNIWQHIKRLSLFSTNFLQTWLHENVTSTATKRVIDEFRISLSARNAMEKWTNFSSSSCKQRQAEHFFCLQSENCQRVFASFSLEKSSLRTSKRFLFDQVSRRLFHSIKVHWMKQLELTLISDQNFTLKHEPTESCLQFPESSFL